MKKTVTLSLLFVLAGTAACGRHAPDPTVVFVVRHAEKAVGGEDPPLTEAGTRRAQALVQVTQDVNLGAIYVTQFIRSHETAKPVSDKTGVPVTEVPANLYNPGDYGQVLAKRILAEHPGKSVLVIAHQNTVPGIVEGLSGQLVPGLMDGEYSRLFVIVIPRDGAPRLIRAQYGQPDGT